MTRPRLAGAASLTPAPCMEAKLIGRGWLLQNGAFSVPGWPLNAPRPGSAPIPPRPTVFRRHLHPWRPSAARASPGSKVQSNRGAVREMQLRFLSTLLRMVPTPPPPWRFRHRPPRRRELVSLSCRIRERRPPPRCSLLVLRWNDSARRARRVQAGEAPWRAANAQPELRSREDQREPMSFGRPAGICSAEPKRLRPERAGAGRRAGASAQARRDGGGASAPNPGISLRRQGGLSPGAPSQLRGQKPETRQECAHTPKLGRDGGVAGARQQVPTWFEQPGEGQACPGQHEASGQRSWQMVTSTFSPNCVHVFPGRFERQRTMFNNNIFPLGKTES